MFRLRYYTLLQFVGDGLTLGLLFPASTLIFHALVLATKDLSGFVRFVILLLYGLIVVKGSKSISRSLNPSCIGPSVTSLLQDHEVQICRNMSLSAGS